MKRIPNFARAIVFGGTIVVGIGTCSAQTNNAGSDTKVVRQSVQSAAQSAARHPTAVLHTTAGDITCELFPDQAPKTVANFIGLATGAKDWANPSTGKLEHNHPLYDGVIFHRVIPGFMIQGGDPTGSGNGWPGYRFEDELLPDLLFDRPGRLAMANSGPNTNGSQFFITEVEVPRLNPCLDDGGCTRPRGVMAKNSGYTIFGQCNAAAIDLVKTIAQGPCKGVVCDGKNSRPDNPVKILHIEIQNGSKDGTSSPPAR